MSHPLQRGVGDRDESFKGGGTREGAPPITAKGGGCPFKTQYLCWWVLISKDCIAGLIVNLLLLISHKEYCVNYYLGIWK